jgi:CDP-glucose 4,6-dehydratase
MNWKNKRVMVTGDWGFIGGALSRKLFELDVETFGYDLTAGYDVLNFKQLEHFLKVNEIELVYHLAAQAHVPIANKYPFDTLQTNILGTLNVVELCSELKIPCIIASSDHAYGEAVTGFTVDSPLNAKYPYDVSKACGDRIALTYVDRGADIKIMHLCNVYGPGDAGRHRLIPHIISSYLSGEQPVLRGDPGMIREWIYIEDAVQAYLDIVDSEETSFVTGGWQHSVGEVVETIRTKLKGAYPIVKPDYRYEINKLAILQIGTGNIPFIDGIDRTIEWWRSTR